MTETPDIIIIEEEHSEEIHAVSADIFVVIKGSSFWTGGAALRKAKEVNILVFELGQIGLTEEDVHLQDVRAEVETGIFTSSSSAQYLLRISCTDLEKLSEILSVISAQKNAILQGINWQYPDTDENRCAWLEKSIKRANVRANKIAGELGVSLRGIKKFTEKYIGREPQKEYALSDFISPVMGRARAAAAPGGLSFSLSHAKKTGVAIYIEYKVTETKAV